MSLKKEKALGRGLSALLGEESMDTPPQNASGSAPLPSPKALNDKYQELDIHKIYPNKGQPRKIFDDSKLEELTESIKQYGVLQPIIVRPAAGGQFEIIAGERRWRASQAAKMEVIPAIVQNADQEESMKLGLIENIQRSELLPLEEAIAYEDLMEIYKYTQEALANTLGKSRSHIANMLRLNKLDPSVKRALADGQITYGHARCLIGNESPHLYIAQIIEQNLTVRELESHIKGNKASKSKKKHKQAASSVPTDDELKIIEARLTENLKAKVHIVISEREQKIVIYFNDYNQLDDIINKMS